MARSRACKLPLRGYCHVRLVNRGFEACCVYGPHGTFDASNFAIHSSAGLSASASCSIGMRASRWVTRAALVAYRLSAAK